MTSPHKLRTTGDTLNIFMVVHARSQRVTWLSQTLSHYTPLQSGDFEVSSQENITEAKPQVQPSRSKWY